MALRSLKSLKVQNGSYRFRSVDEFADVRRITVPGQEIQWNAFLPAISKEFQKEVRGDKLLILKFSSVSKAWTSDLQTWVRVFYFGRGRTVKLQELLVRARPHGRPVLRLVPNLEMLNSVVEPAGPTVVVVPNDPEADLRPFFRIWGRVNKALGVHVLNALAQTIDDFRGGTVRCCQILVR